jgi:urease accessory protein
MDQPPSVSLASRPEPSPAGQNRARGILRAEFRRAGPRTEPGRAYETGGYRLRFPNVHGQDFCEAVMVNTGGGMAAGDHTRFDFRCAEGAAVTLMTTAAEKIYRSDGETTRIDVTLEAEAGARLEWLPQETILFDGARLDRRLDAALAPGASLLVVELLVFGRLAMGEVMRSGALRDRWRIHRGGELVFAEALRLDGDMAAQLDRPALGAGARAAANLLLIGPEAEGRLDAARDSLARGEEAGCVGGASAWNGMLAARALSPSPERLRAAILALLVAVRGRALPRLWS